MSYSTVNSKIIYADYQATLLNGSSITSGWIDMEDVDKVQFSGYADTAGMRMTIESKVNNTTAPTQLSTPVTYSDGTFYMFNVICRQRWMRFTWENVTGGTVNDASMEVKQTFGSSDKLSVFPVGVAPSVFSQAGLMQAIVRGLDTDGNYQNLALNTAGAALTSDFGTEVARGLYSGWAIGTKFGRNGDIDTGSTPEDMWNGGGEYTGFNPTQNRNIQVFSSDVNDVGTVVSSGTSTGGSSTTLVDSGATFITDGVAVGDCVINDTTISHGFVTAVTSETQLTVYRMTNGSITQTSNSSGEDYRVVNANSTGAAVIRLEQILNSDYEEQDSIYVVLQGGTTVTSTVDAYRCTRAKVILAGSTGTNEGTITIRQETDITNVFAQVPTTGQTTIAAYTVPANKVMVVKRVRLGIVRASGTAGSGNINLNVREPGGAWRAVRSFELQTGGPTEFTNEGGLVFTEGYDVKYTIAGVSDNNTIAEGAFEYYLINE